MTCAFWRPWDAVEAKHDLEEAPDVPALPIDLERRPLVEMGSSLLQMVTAGGAQRMCVGLCRRGLLIMSGIVASEDIGC